MMRRGARSIGIRIDARPVRGVSRPPPSGRDRLLFRRRRNMLSFPFNASTPILYYNRFVPAAASIPSWRQDLGGGRRRGERLRGSARFAVSHVVAVMGQCREFSAFHMCDLNQGHGFEVSMRC